VPHELSRGFDVGSVLPLVREASPEEAEGTGGGLTLRSGKGALFRGEAPTGGV